MIDCGVYNDWTSARASLPYLDRNFRDYFECGSCPVAAIHFRMHIGPGSTRKGICAPCTNNYPKLYKHEALPIKSSQQEYQHA